MSALTQIAAAVRVALDASAQARQALREASGSLEHAAAQLAQVLQGVGDSEVAQAPALLSNAARTTAETYRTLVDAESRTRIFLANLGLDASQSDRQRAPDGDTPSHIPPPPRDRIEQLRQELPPPFVRGSGRKTHGRWIGPDGTAQPMVSGRDALTRRVNAILDAMGCPTLPVIASADVELKLAARMRDEGEKDPAMRHVTVVLNHRPCKGRLGCEGLLPVVLPEGYSLTVHAPDYRKRFTGGATPWWR